MVEWVIRTVLALCTKKYKFSRTDGGPSESFKMVFGFHPGSVLSPLLLTILQAKRFVPVRGQLLIFIMDQYCR